MQTQTDNTTTIKTYRIVPEAELQKHYAAFRWKIFEIGIHQESIKTLTISEKGEIDYQFKPLFPLLAPQTKAAAQTMAGQILASLSEKLQKLRAPADRKSLQPVELPSDFPDMFAAQYLVLDTLHLIYSENSIYPYAGKEIAAWEAVYYLRFHALDYTDDAMPKYELNGQLSGKYLRMVFVNNVIVELHTNYSPIYPVEEADLRPLKLPVGAVLDSKFFVSYQVNGNRLLPMTWVVPMAAKVPLCEGEISNDRPKANLETDTLIYFDANGTDTLVGTLLVEYKYNTKEKGKGGTLLLNNIEYVGNDTNIIRMKDIMDTILDNSGIARICYDEMMAMKKLFVARHNKSEKVRAVISGQHSKYDESNNTIRIGFDPAPSQLISRGDKVTLLKNPNIYADIFHECFGHAYDFYTVKTSSYDPNPKTQDVLFTKAMIPITVNSATIIPYPFNHLNTHPEWVNYTTKQGLSGREEFSVHMENLYRNEQKLDMRYTYPWVLYLPARTAEGGGDYDLDLDIILIETSSNGFKRKYRDNFEYEI